METRFYSRHWILWLVLGLILSGALFLRFWRLDMVPPGWRDDELINSLVISQHVLDGDLAVYYPDASGHEALYHALNAIMLGIFGPGVAGIRWLSSILGAATVLLAFLLGRQLFGSLTGLVAAAALAVSFWSLMYSRVGIRHVLLPVLALAAFLFLFRGLGIGESHKRSGSRMTADFYLAGLFMGLGFYSYFASRGVPFIVIAFLIYVAFFAPSLLRQHWRRLLIMFAAAFLMAIPLLVTLAQQPDSEARVAELAVPAVEARAGNFAPLQEHVVTTLGMFHATGDGEWLYNIPNRPVFGTPGALFFWAGVLLALIYTLRPIQVALRGHSIFSGEEMVEPMSLSSAFLLIWWLAGISPAFISVPPASLGHTILAQPAVYLLLALPIYWLALRLPQNRRWIAALAASLLILAVAARDLPDYFLEWPQRGMTRFLYRADISDVARHLNEHPEIQDFAVSGLLAGPWDRLALVTELGPEHALNARPRWYDPRRALVLTPALSFSGFPVVDAPLRRFQQPVPRSERVGGYRLMETEMDFLGAESMTETPICFENGLCWTGANYDALTGHVYLQWEVGKTLQLPEMPLVSNPPPPGVYAGPRLSVFAHLQDGQGQLLAGDDGLWVDAQTLHQGDRFVQQHQLPLPADADRVTITIGLYDPMTNERVLTEDGRDHIRLEVGNP